MSLAVIVAAVLLMPAATRAQQAARGSGESSGSFDIQDVEPFLLRVATLVDSGLTAADVRALVDDVAKLPVGAQREYRYTVKTKSGRGSLRLVVVMDDVDAADLTFFTGSDLARRVNEAMGQFFEDMEQ